MAKKLCGWKKDHLKENLEDYKSIVNNPKCVCKKCGRAANEKKLVCKPVSL